MNNGVIVKDKRMDHEFLKMLFFFFFSLSFPFLNQEEVNAHSLFPAVL